MSKIVWDATSERLYETGVRNVVLYPMGTEGKYDKGVAWNGVTAITESPSGAEATPLYADDTKYLELRSVEEFGASIEAYTYPDEFAECDGSAELVAGMRIGQQPRKAFGLCYRTTLGNDTEGEAYGYKIHVIYGAKAAPSEKAYASINDSPEAITFSWELTTTPVDVANHKPTSYLEFNSKTLGEKAMAAIEALLYGDTDTEASLPSPDEFLAAIQSANQTA